MTKPQNTKPKGTKQQALVIKYVRSTYLKCKHPSLKKYIKSCTSLKICPNETIGLSCSTDKE